MEHYKKRIKALEAQNAAMQEALIKIRASRYSLLATSAPELAAEALQEVGE